MYSYFKNIYFHFEGALFFTEIYIKKKKVYVLYSICFILKIFFILKVLESAFK